MKVLFLYTPNQSLLSHFYEELLKMLVKDGHEVFVFYEKKNPTHYKKHGVVYAGQLKGSLISRYLNVYNSIKVYCPDVLISNFSYINPALICGKLLGVKRNIAWFHTAFSHSQRHWFHVWFKSQCFKLADVVITNSKTLSQDMQEYYQVNPLKLVEIPFWTTIGGQIGATFQEQYTKKEGQKDIGIPGRLVKDKNHDLVLRSLAHLKLSGFSWRLFIAGSGPYEKELKRLCDTLSIADNVVFLGDLSTKQMIGFYKQMDFLVLPSMHEAFGLVFIEATAIGAPVIVSKAFGALDFIDVQTFDCDSFVFDPSDQEDLNEKLLTFFNENGPSSQYFKELYLNTYDKLGIYSQIQKTIQF
ncbi:glycosyltransferase family 4 protein [Mangrovimonas sp. AS39]|uniref:glycosyltransferase family 4 protein n=1 Tax=Mangrovimonas futianensis TaxID=2895523 RepID=UPI001E4EA596|nr:glycosyltransferase family 4 protein [Mangrovimonas futianensis]MCF1191220.1 glycosyltransferase family 4 protein [Mangrovimonas futianensis]MCF1194915.1 glycosyltransferase family 4 protein [Mangrovimonas futianensis]